MAEAELLPHFRSFINLIYRGYNDTVPTIKAAVIIIGDELDLNTEVALQYFDHLFSLFEQLVAQRQGFQATTLALMYDTVSNIIQGFPNLVSDNAARFDFLIKASVQILALISTQESEAWLNPTEGTEQELFDNDEDMQATRVVIGCFDKVSKAAGCAATRKHFRAIFDHYITRVQDWRYVYSSIIVASQLGQDYQEIEEFNSYIQSAIHGLAHEQSRVRYASLQLISQYAIDLRPLFQENYFDQVVPPLFNILRDPMQRVVAVGFDCLNNFFDDFKDFWRTEGCVNQLLPVLVDYLKFGPNWLKQGALTVLNCLATIKNALAMRVGQILSLSRELISAYQSLQSFDEMVSNLYQLMTNTLCSQDRVYTESYLPQYIQIIFNYRQNIDESSYILSWCLFCETYGNFTDLHLFYPLLFKSIQNEISKNVTEDMLSALSCLVSTSSSFKAEFQPYFQEVYEMMQNIIKDGSNFMEFREKAMAVMISITKDIKNGTAEADNKWFSYSCNNLTIFLDLLDKGLESKPCFFKEVEFWLMGCNDAVNQLGSALSEHHIMTLLTKLSTYQYKIECLEKSANDGDGPINETNPTDNDEDYEDIDSSQGQELIFHAEEDTILGSLEFIVQIYTSLLNFAEPSQKSLISNFLVPIISTSIPKQDHWKEFALGLAVALTEKCTYDIISNIWSQVISLFTQFCSHSDPRIRNIAIFGMGIIFEKTPLHLISDASILSSLDLISKSITQPFTRGEETSDAAKNCKDNSYSTLGKLLKSYSSNYPSILTRQIYSEWMNALPLNFDEDQGDQQQIFLTEIMHANPAVLVSEVKDIVRICQIYAKFAMKRTEERNGAALLKTKESLREISQWQLFAQSTELIWNNLTHSQRTTISKLLKS